MPKLCFTVDLDRDVNIPIPGHREAGSLDRGQGPVPRFSSSKDGLRLFSELFDELSVKATFFTEGRTLETLKDLSGFLDGYEIGCHGLDHEDFSTLSYAESIDVLTTSKNIIKDISGTCPKSFRAPYMKASEDIFELLSETGFETDSSLYAESKVIVPYCTSKGIVEVPVLKKNGVEGVTHSSYLWPLHEGKRSVRQFLSLFEGIEDNRVLVLCDHSWHITESRSNGLRSVKSVSENLGYVREILESLLDAGYEACTVSDAARLCV